MTETLNDRLDRLEAEIKSLAEKINQIKPQEIDISEEIKDAINQSVTRDFVNKLYRG